MAQRRRDQFLGSVALVQVIDIQPPAEASPATLLGDVCEASRGNKQALRRVHTNVRTDVAERLFKAGHQTSVQLERTPGGFEQDGLPLTAVHHNTLEHMPLNDIMRARTQSELGNIFLFEELDDAGIFETHDAVVFSATPTDAETRQDYNFFTDTDSLSIQYLKKTGDTSFVMETAMVAGKTAPDAQRHDLRAVRQMLHDAGMHDTYFSENQALRFVMLVRKTPGSGVHTIVERYDDIVGGTFYGEYKPRQDYGEYRKVCENRSKDFDSIVSNVVHDLIAEASTLTNAYEAIERLDELSDKYCVNAAIERGDIDEKVFGKAAAEYIRRARIHKQNGDYVQLEQALQNAVATSESSSCPFKLIGKQEDEDSKKAGALEELLSGKKSMTCPFCKERTTGDPCAAAIECTKCSASTKLSAAENQRRAKAYRQNKKSRTGILRIWDSKK